MGPNQEREFSMNFAEQRFRRARGTRTPDHILASRASAMAARLPPDDHLLRLCRMSLPASRSSSPREGKRRERREQGDNAWAMTTESVRSLASQGLHRL